MSVAVKVTGYTPTGDGLDQVKVPLPPVALKVAPAGRLDTVRVMGSLPMGSVAVTAKVKRLLTMVFLSPMGARVGGVLSTTLMETVWVVAPSLSVAMKRGEYVPFGVAEAQLNVPVEPFALKVALPGKLAEVRVIGSLSAGSDALTANDSARPLTMVMGSMLAIIGGMEVPMLPVRMSE